MRKILFRGQRTDNKEWIEGCYIESVAKNSPFAYITTSYPSEPIRVYSKTVGQYTCFNLKDTKVFDGDIIDVFPSNRKMYVFFNEETLAWELADVGTKPCEINHLINCISLGELGVEACFENEVRSKVIGNIHNNPELMIKECV